MSPVHPISSNWAYCTQVQLNTSVKPFPASFLASYHKPWVSDDAKSTVRKENRKNPVAHREMIEECSGWVGTCHCLSGSSSDSGRMVTPADDCHLPAAHCSPQSRVQVGRTGSSVICWRSWRWALQATGTRCQRCADVGSSWHRRRTENCCRSPEALPVFSAAETLPPASPCHCAAPGNCCCNVWTPMKKSSCRSTRSLVQTCRPHPQHTCIMKLMWTWNYNSWNKLKCTLTSAQAVTCYKVLM